jgi:hypothetical protein
VAILCGGKLALEMSSAETAFLVVTTTSMVIRGLHPVDERSLAVRLLIHLLE